MLNISLNELVYDLIELYRANHKSTDSLSEEQVKNWIHATRAAILKSRLDKNPFYIDESWVQSLGRVLVESGGLLGDINYIKTINQIPLTINRRGGEGTFTFIAPGDIGVIPYNIVSFDRAQHSGYGIFNGNTKYVFPYNNYLYIKNETLAALTTSLGLSAEYVTSWTNSGYETFTPGTGNAITSAINSASSGTLTSNSFTLRAGETITTIATITLNSGTAPTLQLKRSGNIIDSELIVPTSINISLVADEDGTYTLNLVNSSDTDYSITASTNTVNNYITVKGVFFNPELAATFAGLEDFENLYDYPIDQSIITTMQSIIKKENFNFIIQQLEDKKLDGIDSTTKDN